MLIDKNCIIILCALTKSLAGAGFEIIEKLDLITTLEPALTIDELNFALAELSAGGYIKLKFNDKDEFCLSITPLGRQSAEQLEKLRIKELSAKAIVGKSSSGKIVVTTLDDSPIYDEPPTADESEQETQDTPIVEESKSKQRKQAGRIATFFYGAFGGVFGSSIVVSIMYLLTHFGVIA